MMATFVYWLPLVGWVAGLGLIWRIEQRIIELDERHAAWDRQRVALAAMIDSMDKRATSFSRAMMLERAGCIDEALVELSTFVKDCEGDKDADSEGEVTGPAIFRAS